MDFKGAEQQFHLLDNQFKAGQINLDQYRAGLTQLRVTDSNGVLWQLQEISGVWFTFSQGQWVMATPPGGTAISPPPNTTQPARQGMPNRSVHPKPLGIIAGVLFVIAVFVVGAVYLLKSGKLTISPGQSNTAAVDGMIAFSQSSTLTLKTGESTIQDSHGTSLQVSATSMPSQDSLAQLTSLDASQPLIQALNDGYTLETPFYEVSLQGQNDGAGPASLSLPAPSPDSRLLVVVDQQYAFLLNVLPQNGKLTTSVHLGPADLSGIKPTGTLTASGSIYYATVTPKQSAAVPSSLLASNTLPQAETSKDCSPVSLRAATIFQRCRSNAEGTVMVIFPFRLDLTYFDADAVVQAVESAMTAYAGKGFTAAKLSTASPMLVVISDGYTSPEYNFKTGVIYLPPDIPKKLSTENTALWHEMGHWIQNKVYSMALAGVSGARRWWLEVSAEMMVMQLKPDYIAANMSSYGTITTGDGSVLALQSSPYQWPADFYVQAQLVMVNTCDSGGCPLTTADFVAAINNGTYPFDDSSAQEKLTANLEDYARYLLGTSPLSANSGISLAAVQTQDSFGQTVMISKTNKTDLSFTTNGSAPQIQKVAKETGDNLVITAPLEKDGVYPLLITSGNGGKYIGIPVILVISAGMPFDYRVDGGDVQVSDGSQEVTIGPIHAGLGITSVRLVAYSKSGGQSFQAHLEPVDLKGAWVIIPTNLVSNSIQCTGDDTENGPTPEGVAQLGSSFFSLIGAMGNMEPDTTGLSLDWNLMPSRLPATVKTSDFTYKSSAVVTSDGVELQGELDLPKPSSSTSQRPPLPAQPLQLAWLAVLPAAGLVSISQKKKKRWLGLISVLLLMAVILTGCLGFAFYGTFNGDTKITKMEYSNGSGKATWTMGNPVDGKPIWTFTQGTASYPIDFTIETSTDNADGTTTNSTEKCTGTAVYAITGGIYEDIDVIIPNSSN